MWKDFFGMMFWLLLPFAFLPLVVSCQNKETEQKKAQCFKQGGQPIVQINRNVMTGCILPR